MIKHLKGKWIAAISMLFIGVLNLQAQQEPQYTQFMYNKLPINAGYTGSREVLSLRALYRNQWTGIQGAPQTATLSIHSPFKRESSAMGFYMVNDRLGVTNQTWFDVTYAYRIRLGKGIKMSIGINAGMLWYKSNLSELNTNETADPVLQENVNRVLPDFGAGLYIYHKSFYLGLSVPNFIKGELYNKSTIDNSGNDPSGSLLSAHRTPHLFVIAGGVIPAGKILKIRPQFMYKYIAEGSQQIPHEYDFNLSLLFFDRFNIGATYRTSFQNNKTSLTNVDGVDVLLEVWPVKNLLIGFAYDYTLTELSQYNKGSYEVILGYEFANKKKNLVTPRYF
jgi:type IX secretion system PorP/SprF family membrane protein